MEQVMIFLFELGGKTCLGAAIFVVITAIAFSLAGGMSVKEVQYFAVECMTFLGLYTLAKFMIWTINP